MYYKVHTFKQCLQQSWCCSWRATDITFIHMLAWQNMHLNQMRGIMPFIYLRHIKKKKKNDRPKDTWHMWQVRGGSKSDWSPLHLQNDCFPLTTFGWGSVETFTELCLLTKSLRSKEEPPEGAEIVTQLMYSGTSRDTWTQSPAPPLALIWTNARSKRGSFVNRVSQTVLFKTQKQEAA